MEYNGYMIEGDGTFGMKLIKPIGRGSVPAELRGSWSSTGFARKAIDALVGKKESINAEVNVSG